MNIVQHFCRAFINLPAKLFSVLFALSLLLVIHPARAVGDTTSILEITTATVAAAPACLQWRPSGVCFWVTCSPFGCKFSTSLRVTHMQPRAVVSTYHDPATHPWWDFGRPVAINTQKIASGLLSSLVDSAGTRSRPEDGRDKNHVSRDGDAFGHPAGKLSDILSDTGLLCPATTTAFYPYYSAHLDALSWRDFFLIENIYPPSLIPGLREIGTFPLNTWGNVYPRHHKTTQQHPVKAAAVLTQRIGDIVTREESLRVSTAMPTLSLTIKEKMLIWLPPPLMENQPLTGMWQQLNPIPKPFCELFGINDTVGVASWGDGQTTGTAAYSFSLWQPVSCCDVKGTTFLGYIGL
jgi:integrating conjugative element protein (TIGR03756 family)